MAYTLLLLRSFHLSKVPILTEGNCHNGIVLDETNLISNGFYVDPVFYNSYVLINLQRSVVADFFIQYVLYYSAGDESASILGPPGLSSIFD